MKYSANVQRLHIRQNKRGYSSKNRSVDLIRDLVRSLRIETSFGVEENSKGRRHCALRVERYYKEVVSVDLVLQCSVNTIMEIMPPDKIVISTSSKRMIQDKKQLVVALSALKLISGQKSQATRARRSIAAFKLREGSVLGCKVTLRGKAMYSFLNKLIFLVLPRAVHRAAMRPSFINQHMDANSNYNIGIADPFLFVELESHYELFQSLCGIDIAFVIPALPIYDRLQARAKDRTLPNQKAMVSLLLSGLQMQVGL